MEVWKDVVGYDGFYQVSNLGIAIETKKPNFTSSYKGVSFHKFNNKWIAFTKLNGKTKHLGYFKTETDAHNAYQKYINSI